VCVCVSLHGCNFSTKRRETNHDFKGTNIES